MYIGQTIIQLLLICFMLIGCTPLHRSETKYIARKGVYHTVQKGETLWRISKTYNVEMSEIVSKNGLSSAEMIKAGQRLFIPKAEEIKQVLAKGEVSLKDGKVYSSVQEKKNNNRQYQNYNEKNSEINFIWPVKGEIISRFGQRDQKRHLGIDIKCPLGTPILAAFSGKVVYSGGGLRGYGNMIIIEHDEFLSTVYAHNSVNLVKEKSLVKRGQIIGYVGNTGRATIHHLHFEIRKNNRAEDPLLYLTR